MCDKVKDIENEEIEQEEYSDLDDVMTEINISEEIKRIKKQDIPYEVPVEFKDSIIVKRAEEETVAMIKSFKMLMEAGIDYNNALSISNNCVVAYNQRELAEIQQVQISNQQI